MFFVKDKIVFGMAMMRFLSCTIELTAALLFLKFDNIQTALKINAVLAMIGPAIMAIVMAMGLAGLSGKVSITRFLIISAGVILIFIGVTRKN
ncbi:MAG: DUF2619 domain-containing protein [Firmicutes bacterium HGW-Firmicutes-14]|nr:MAG: DUF2619 domain-containing protein [Firmicutes bacterium HGW-Firmicutes-14]